MIELSVEILTTIFLLAILGSIMTGYPIGAAVGGVGFIIGYLTMGSLVFDLIYTRIYSLLVNYILLAVPLFVFMGVMLERSGITDRLYEALYLWLGEFRGGLAIATVLLGTVLAACLGVVAASVSMLTVIALAPMVQKGYAKALASGSVCAGGCLGILIPPSVMLVLYAPTAGISLGKLFMGAIGPGLLLSTLYCTYIAARSFLQPKVAPAIAREEMKMPFLKKSTMLVTSLFPPVVLVLAVLGSIFFGIAAPTEAAGVGAAAAVLLAIAYRKFRWQFLKDTALETLRITSFSLFIACLSFSAVGIFLLLGCGGVIGDLILAAPFGRWGAFITVMIAIFLLGMFVDWIGIIFIIVPIIAPIIPAMGFDPIWFAIMVCVNLQMSFMSPPFAPAIFICRGTAPPKLGVTSADIIRGVIPFVILIFVGLGLCVLFPEIILWLPSKMVVTGY